MGNDLEIVISFANYVFVVVLFVFHLESDSIH